METLIKNDMTIKNKINRNEFLLAVTLVTLVKSFSILFYIFFFHIKLSYGKVTKVTKVTNYKNIKFI